MKKTWIAAFALFGCKGNTINDPGTNMLDFFPFDDNLDCIWEFAHEDVLKPYGMNASITNYEYRDGYSWYEVSFVKDCRGQTENCTEGELIRRLGWEVRGLGGVSIASLETPTSNYTFEPALKVADGRMMRGEVVETSTGGSTYTSTVDFTDCPVPLETFDDCARFDIDTSDGVLDTVGTLWAINDYNVIAVDWLDQDGLWQLVGHTIDQ